MIYLMSKNYFYQILNIVSTTQNDLDHNIRGF